MGKFGSLQLCHGEAWGCVIVGICCGMLLAHSLAGIDSQLALLKSNGLLVGMDMQLARIALAQLEGFMKCVSG